MTRIICLFVIVLFTLPVNGSQTSHAIVHLDKPFYVVGETIWYSLVLPPNLQADNGLAEIAFFSPGGVALETYHLRVRENAAEGYQKIRFDWPEGIYQLQMKVYDLSSFDSQVLAVVPVSVFNDLNRTPQGLAGRENDRIPAPGGPAGDLTVTIELQEETVAPRREATGTITVTDRNGNPVDAQISVSVTDADLIPGNAPVLHISELPVRPMVIDSLLRFDGIIKTVEGEDPGAAFFLAAYLKPLDSLTYTIPERTGRFGIALPNFFGKGTVQFADIRADDFRIIPSPDQSPGAVADGSLIYSEAIENYLDLSRQRKKIYQLYNTLEMIPEEADIAQDTAFYAPDRHLRVDDYTSMEDIPRFFREISTTLKFRRKQGRYIALMFNPDPYVRSFFPGDPLFIVDGQMTRDANWVAGLDIKAIESVDLFYFSDKLTRRFGAIGRNGVAILRSRSGDLKLPEERSGNIFTVHGLQVPAAFPEIPDEGGESRPVFRPQVYWNPNLRTDAGGKTEVQFKQTDVISRYLIKVLASGRDGRTGTGTLIYEVR